MTNLRVGILGFGNWGKNQARVFNEIGNLSGVYEKNLNEEDKNLFSYVFFNSIEELINESDAVVICTPAQTHFELAKKCIEKLDILVEKPLALNVAQVKELILLEKKFEKIIMVGHQLHFHSAVVKMKNLIKEGVIGDIKWIYSNRLNMGRIRPYENVLWSFAPHDVSLIIDFVNSKIKKIQFQSTKILNAKNEDTSLTLLEFKNKIKAHIFVSWIHPFKEQRFTVVGEKGSFVFSDTEAKEKLVLFNTKIDKSGKILEHNRKIIDYEEKEPLKAQAEYFVNSLKNRKIDINNSSHALEVIKILEKSSDKS